MVGSIFFYMKMSQYFFTEGTLLGWLSPSKIVRKVCHFCFVFEYFLSLLCGYILVSEVFLYFHVTKVRIVNLVLPFVQELIPRPWP